MVDHQVLAVAGRQVGDLIVNAHQVTLFTVVEELRALDGTSFSSVEAAELAVIALVGRGREEEVLVAAA